MFRMSGLLLFLPLLVPRVGSLGEPEWLEEFEGESSCQQSVFSAYGEKGRKTTVISSGEWATGVVRWFPLKCACPRLSCRLLGVRVMGEWGFAEKGWGAFLGLYLGLYCPFP